MIKQIAMVGILGLALVLATVTIYPQHVFAARNVGGGTFSDSGGNGGFGT